MYEFDDRYRSLNRSLNQLMRWTSNNWTMCELIVYCKMILREKELETKTIICIGSSIAILLFSLVILIQSLLQQDFEPLDTPP